MNLLALTITLKFNTWLTPALITVGSFLAFALIAWKESREGGDYSIPMFSFMAFSVFCAATAASWIVYALS